MSDQEHLPAAERHQRHLERINAAYDPKIRSILDEWTARGSNAALPPEEPPPVNPSARDVRIGWYIPRRHAVDTLDNFRALTDTQRLALQAVRDWIESVMRGDGGALALVGGVGCGKSHLLYAACRELNEAGIHCAASGWYDLADVFRQAKYGHDEDVTEARVKKSRILNAGALCIDEIRPTSGTDYDTTELSQLMTRAYRECQGIFVTSNYADTKLSAIVGLAASSRLTQVAVAGPDMRKPENRKLRAS
jgi:DNA replication protein DnaC